MGIPLTIFTLHRLEGADCAHHLLLRVRQPGFSNADAGDLDRAVQSADARRDALIRRYTSKVLPRECAAAHEMRLIGEMQAWPVGDDLAEGAGGGDVDVWIAQTRYGAPWVVMGTAESEAAFWRAVGEDDDLAGLDPLHPALRRRAFFLTDGDDEDPATP
jgi:hypothetical protein